MMFRNLSRICAEDCAVPCANPWRIRSEPDALRDARGSAFRNRSERTDGERNTEDAEIVVIDLVPQTGVADLVESLELIEADGIAVGHQDAMEDDRETRLAEGVDFLGFTKQLRACGNEQMLAVVRVNVRREQALDGAGKAPIEAIDQNGF